ncbi:MAG: hypothetical protein ABI551_25525 [Polyangiaceae bacterium]
MFDDRRPGPHHRNALLAILVPIAIILGGGIVRAILTTAFYGSSLVGLVRIGALIESGGILYYYVVCHRMLNELKSVTKNQSFRPWAIWVPLYNLVYFFGAIPLEMTRAKQLVGARQPIRSLALYFLFPLYAIAADLNDIVAARAA